ncbi:tetratricopeptide repeat protein [Actinoplanes sp. TBRC 11911]|uniref:FxSxx-COOH system tetratricopeptide repeat protein n=1 Tax=Actinoplanes sp. TBRC 11911 TaxID=2729386 RepID=UPI00145F0529|nr:FxSxx-COOH system tetratricopeptide repeat protein [Actinoplanes sp. TBRC 11911]NMO49803.1 tetratricopeptide repeat protein [Actinoplanes sp. TBRC 11911]
MTTPSPFGVPPLAEPDLLAGALRGLGPQPMSLAFVVDEGPTMPVWEPTVTAFREVLESVFAEVRAYSLQSFQDASPSRAALTGRLVLVLTDGLDNFWGGQAAASLLQTWGRTAPVAIVNPYPEDRWYRSHLGPRLLQVAGTRPLAPNAALRVQEPDRWRDPFEPAYEDPAVVVPLLELSPRWLRWWTGLVAEPTGDWLDAVVYVADPSRATGTGGTDTAEVAGDQLVRRFREEAPPKAFQLATYLAAAPLEMPVLRAIQSLLLPDSKPFHLAEVVTSPLLDHAGAALSFRAGAREALLACARRDETVRVIEVLSGYYGGRVPAVQTLYRALEAPDEVPDNPVTAETLPFVAVELAVLRALAGDYALRAVRLDAAMAEFRQRQDEPRPVVPLTELPLTSPPVPAEEPPLGPGGDTFSISRLLGGAERSVSQETVWGNVPPRNADFTGRDDLLVALEERLRTQRVTAVLPQALHGAGGVGKSQIATEYAYRHRADYEVVWWIPSEQPAQILRALIELGETLGLNVGPEANTAVPAVQEALRAGRPYPNWLLIFDNAETLESVRPYLPQGGTGRVLVTSRNEQWSDIADALQIDVFNRAESIELLRKHNPDISIEDADRLAALLDDLPLAIGQATAWRATTHMPIEEYLRLLAEKREALRGQAAAPGYELAVAAAWTVALDRLGQENPAALQMLQACSFLAPEPISRELFLGPRTPPISPELDATLQNPSRLNQALRDIQRYGLARIDYRDNSIQLHRLVKTVLVSQLTEQQRMDMQHAAHMLLAGGNPGNPDLENYWPRYHALLPHVVASDAVGCEDDWARQLVLHIIEFYYYWGDHNGCRDFAEKVVAQWRKSLGRDDPQTLKAARWLGFVQRTLGNFQEAARINADSLDRLRLLLGPDDEETLDAMALVAADLRAAGAFTAARDLDQEVLTSCLAAFGPDYPSTLTAAHSLGVSLRLTGEFRAALVRDAETSRRRSDVLGTNHLLTLFTLNGLTLDLRECGRYLQAHAEQEKLYERMENVLGQDHPQTLMAARNLAVARRRAGEHDKARKLAHDTLTRFRLRFGEAHPETLASALNYAVDQREDDQLQSSRELATKTYAQYESTLGPDHPYTLYARTNLGIVLRLLGRFGEAYRHDAAAYTGLRERLGPDHGLTLTCATNLASDLAARGDHAEAYELDKDTLERSRARLGAEHPSTLACALNLSFDAIALGRDTEGASLRQEALDGYRRVLGEKHPAIVAALAGVRANCDVDPMPL